jgi:uncharacterized protein YggE
MYKKHLLIGGMVLLAIVLSACGVAAAQTSSASDTPSIRTLSVTGSGQVFLSPDIADISVGVHTEGKDAAKAVADNNSQTQKVIQMIKDMGVADKDIQTTNFSIYPRQEYDDQGRVTGITYVVENTVRITVRDLDKIGELLNAVVESGANNIFGIQFDVEDRVTALASARQAAVQNAQTIAEELAQAAGVKLGPVQSITVQGSSPIPVVQERAAMAAEQAAVPVSPGQLSLTVDVSVVYEIQ